VACNRLTAFGESVEGNAGEAYDHGCSSDRRARTVGRVGAMAERALEVPPGARPEPVVGHGEAGR